MGTRASTGRLCVTARIAGIAGMAAAMALGIAGGTVLLGAGGLDGPQPPVSRLPEGTIVPRGLSDAEKVFLQQNPNYFSNQMGSKRAAPPTGPVECAAEYEPMDGIFMSWESFTPTLNEMAKLVTTIGNANVYMVVDTASEQTSATTSMTNAEVNMTRVKFYIKTTDTVWIRDYGPRYIYEGNVRAIVDHTYNRPRPLDDALNVWLGGQRKEEVYDVGLVHGGGNYHLNALDKSYCTRLINNENTGLTELQIHDKWLANQAVDTHFFDPFPNSLDSTQHLDMWMQVYADNKVMISDWPVTGGDMTTVDGICDNAAIYMANQGYTVNRVPAREVSNVHYTYTNVVICNDLIIVPSYTNSTMDNAGYNAQALNAWQTANPAKTCIAVNGQPVVTSAGVFHCIMMHVPANRGGANPVAYLRTPNGGDTYTPDTNLDIRWITDDDVSVSNVDLLLSLDGGDTYPITLASATADDGSHTWTIPNYYTHHARIKVIARDASGNTGFDASDADFAIAGACPADFDLTGFADTDDYDAFIEAFEAGTLNADIDGSGFVDLDDFDAFVDYFEAGC
ncbi:MAG: agmatine deiminase family protein [Phycisphaerales bacterium]|nr:agmatine deiminase family protein [Phycisphaerales bacterium]